MRKPPGGFHLNQGWDILIQCLAIQVLALVKPLENEDPLEIELRERKVLTWE